MRAALSSRGPGVQAPKVPCHEASVSDLQPVLRGKAALRARHAESGAQPSGPAEGPGAHQQPVEPALEATARTGGGAQVHWRDAALLGVAGSGAAKRHGVASISQCQADALAVLGGRRVQTRQATRQRSP